MAIADCDADPILTALLVDQRGVPRPQGAGCDTGAFEDAFELPIWARDPVFFFLLTASSEVVATSLDVQLAFAATQGAAEVTAAIVKGASTLAGRVWTALNAPDAAGGKSLLLDAADASAALQHAITDAVACCEISKRLMPAEALTEALAEFDAALGKAMQRPPTPGDNPGK